MPELNNLHDIYICTPSEVGYTHTRYNVLHKYLCIRYKMHAHDVTLARKATANTNRLTCATLLPAPATFGDGAVIINPFDVTFVTLSLIAWFTWFVAPKYNDV